VGGASVRTLPYLLDHSGRPLRPRGPCSNIHTPPKRGTMTSEQDAHAHAVQTYGKGKKRRAASEKAGSSRCPPTWLFVATNRKTARVATELDRRCPTLGGQQPFSIYHQETNSHSSPTVVLTFSLSFAAGYNSGSFNCSDKKLTQYSRQQLPLQLETDQLEKGPQSQKTP
jgi:hypothetical protein